MTTIGLEFRNHILGFPGIADKVGERIYPDVLPQNERHEVTADLPAVVFNEFQADGYTSLGSGYTCHHETRLQVDVWGRERQQAADIAKLIEQVCVGRRMTWGGVQIHFCRKVSGFTGHQAAVQLKRSQINLRIRFQK